MGNILLLYWCVVISVSDQQWKVSKAMKNTLKVEEEVLVQRNKLISEAEAREEKELKIKNMKTKSFQDLRNILYPKYEAEHKESPTRTTPLQLSGKDCTRHDPLWVRKCNFTDHKHSLLFKIFVATLGLEERPEGRPLCGYIV